MAIRVKCIAAMLALLVLTGGGLRAADEGASAAAAGAGGAAAGMELMKSLVGGEWRINAKWADGNPLSARATYDWGVGKKFVEARTFVAKPEGGEYQRYLTVFGAKDDKLISWGFVFDGSSDQAEWTAEGKKLTSVKPMKSAADKSSTGAVKPSTLHQSIEIVGPDKLRWLVAIETDGKMNQLMDGYWLREKSAGK